jgi:hypothetical protein
LLGGAVALSCVGGAVYAVSIGQPWYVVSIFLGLPVAAIIKTLRSINKLGAKRSQ